MLRSD